VLSVPVLRPWRPIWDATLGSATQRLDELAAERRKGRSAPPQVAPEVLRLVGVQRVQTALRGPQLPAVREFLQVMREIKPLLRACVWPRWLLLEEALDDASRSGALHLSALILRTQIEELDALRTVAAVLSATGDDAWDDASLAAAISTLSNRVLPRLQTKTAEQLVEPASDAVGSGSRPAPLQQAFDHLSEYVHPNYGSHILSVRPDSAEAARVFVEAFVAVYEAFLSLPWAQEIDDQPLTPRDPQAELRPAFLVLAEDTVRTLAPALPFAEIGPVPWIDAVNCFHRCAERESSQESFARALENGEVSEGPNLDVEAIRALREHSAPPGGWPEPLGTAAGRFDYALLVKVERQLIDDAEAFSPGGSQRDAKAWLSLLLSGLTFSINVTEHKIDSLARQAARMINAENVLGATLAIRSMLEHHAVAIELGTKLQAIWERAERAAPSEERVTDALAEAEKQIARVLVGSAGSRERSAPWRTLWEQTVRKPYNVLGPIRALDADRPGFLKTYGLLSHLVHGTVCTGGDLLGTRAASSKAGEPTLAQLILFLANLCDNVAMLDRQVASMMIGQRMDVTRRDPQGTGARIKAMRILEGQKLKPGRDIFGSGTASDPYRFRDGLLYHDAYHQYLKQEGIQVRNRRVEPFPGSFGDRVEAEDGRVLYFLNDKLTLG
jgi:hypothetical protein